MEAVCLEPEGSLATTILQLIESVTETVTTATTATTATAASKPMMFPHMHIVNCLNINITKPSAGVLSV